MENSSSSSRKIMCPFCKELCVLLSLKKGKKLLGCGHSIKFKKTRSQKEMDRKYISTPDGGLELVKE